ncbi:MAG: IS1 family transposase [Thermaceae bacterium]|nr:IS1 family transposase [Thermaceae bacterium]
MIQETVTYRCTRCGSENIVRNGTTPYGKQQYKCKDCSRYSVLEPSVKYSEEDKAQILAAYQERSSMRGIQRIYGISRKTLSKWLKKSQQGAN